MIKHFTFRYLAVLIFCYLFLIPGTYLCQNHIWQQKIEYEDHFISAFLDFKDDVVLMQYSKTLDTLLVTKRDSQNGTEVWRSYLIRPAGKANKWFQCAGDLTGNIYILEFLYLDGDNYASKRVYKLNTSGKLHWIKHLDSTQAHGSLYVDYVGTAHITVNKTGAVNLPQTTSEISFDPATGNTSVIRTLFTNVNSVSGVASDKEGNLCFIGYDWIGCSKANGAGRWYIEPGIHIHPIRMCPDNDGNLYVMGYFSFTSVCGNGRYIDTLEFNPKSNENGVSYFVMKIKISTGEIRWTKKIRTGDMSYIRGLYVDRAGNFFTYGSGSKYAYDRVSVLNFNSINGEYKEVATFELLLKWLLIDRSDNLISLHFVRTEIENSNLLTKRGPLELVMFPDNRMSIEVMPNPFDLQLIVYLNRIAPGTYQLDLYDSSGKIVLSMSSDQDEVYLDLRWLQQDIYILSITESDGKRTSKKIVKRES